MRRRQAEIFGPSLTCCHESSCALTPSHAGGFQLVESVGTRMSCWSLRCGLFGNLMSVAVDPYKLAVPLLRAWGFGVE